MPCSRANPAAKPQQQCLEGISLRPTTDNPLLDGRCCLAGQRSQNILIHRDHTPTFRRQSKGAGFLLTETSSLLAALCIGGQKHNSKDSSSLGLWPDGFEIRPRNLTKNSGAVARVAVSATSPTVLHAAKPTQRLAENPMAGFPGQLRQEPDSTGIPFTRNRLRCSGVADRPRCSSGMDGIGHEHQPDGHMICGVIARKITSLFNPRQASLPYRPSPCF